MFRGMNNISLCPAARLNVVAVTGDGVAEAVVVLCIAHLVFFCVQTSFLLFLSFFPLGSFFLLLLLVFYLFFLSLYRLVSSVVKASASRTEDPGFDSRLRRGIIRGRVIPITSKLDWLTLCQYTATLSRRKLDLQLLSQCGSW